MAIVYDRIHKVPLWVIIDLPERLANPLIEDLVEEEGAHYQHWPAKTFRATVKELGRKGWSHIVSQAKPFNLDVQFLAVAIARHIKNAFGENALIPGSHDKPYQHTVNRKIATDADYARIFNEALDLEQEVSLSQIFQTGEMKSKVYITDAPCNRHIIQKLADRVLVVSETEGLVVKGKKNETIKKLVIQEIQQCLSEIQ